MVGLVKFASIRSCNGDPTSIIIIWGRYKATSPMYYDHYHIVAKRVAGDGGGVGQGVSVLSTSSYLKLASILTAYGFTNCVAQGRGPHAVTAKAAALGHHQFHAHPERIATMV